MAAIASPAAAVAALEEKFSVVADDLQRFSGEGADQPTDPARECYNKLGVYGNRTRLVGSPADGFRPSR